MDTAAAVRTSGSGFTSKDIRLLLRHLDVYPFDAEGIICSKKTYNKTIYLESEYDGLWYPFIKENRCIKKNELLGHLEDFFGNHIAEYRALGDGVTFYYTGSLAVKKNQPLIAYGLEEYAWQ